VELRDKLARRAAKAGVSLSDTALAKLTGYFELLRKWNRKVALTSLPVETCGDEAIDRLLIEPLVAVKYFPTPVSAIIDIGSGGGSPAIPLKVAAPAVSMRMVESKTRKAAFLREAVRVLNLDHTEVEPVRFEELLSRPSLHDAADAVTIRAVRLDRKLLLALQSLLRPGGSLFVFTTQGLPVHPFTGTELEPLTSHSLLAHSGSRLAVFKRAKVPD